MKGWLAQWLIVPEVRCISSLAHPVAAHLPTEPWRRFNAAACYANGVTHRSLGQSEGEFHERSRRPRKRSAWHAAEQTVHHPGAICRGRTRARIASGNFGPGDYGDLTLKLRRTFRPRPAALGWIVHGSADVLDRPVTQGGVSVRRTHGHSALGYHV